MFILLFYNKYKLPNKYIWQMYHQTKQSILLAQQIDI
jgi:hypothetical protein